MIFFRGVSLNFKTIEEVKKFLKEEYGVLVQNFPNIEAANEFAGAVVDLSCALKSKDDFGNLKIYYSNIFCADEIMSYMFQKSNDGNVRDLIELNSSKDWNEMGKFYKKAYSQSFNASPLYKGGFIHELAHVLHYRSDKEKFCNLEKVILNDKEVKCALEVSKYATLDAIEFCAEYIRGKMAGITYSDAVDEMFEKYWFASKLQFPN